MKGTAPDGQPNPTMTKVQQIVYPPGGGTPTALPSTAQIKFEPQDGHDHFHLKDAAAYSLWNSARTAEVAPGMKVGFCLEDTEPVESQENSVYDNLDFCQQGNPGASSVDMGVSAGWRDVYNSGLAFQWVDVSDVPPGVYWLRADVDPDNVIKEANEVNPPAYAAQPSIIPGWLAQPLTAPDLPGGAPSALTLSATAVQGTGPSDAAGPLQFRIVTPPAHGTLNVPVGRAFDSPTVTYTPADGYSGPDSFTFAALSATSPFPLTPVVATASLAVGAPAPAVSLGGVPGRLTAGASAQLTATVTGASGGVAWSVSGVPGGNAQVGTITAGGLYRAPAAVPAGGAVMVRADSVTSPGTAAEAPIAIVAPAPPRAAPSSPAGAKRKKRLPVLARPTVSHRGKAIVTRVVPGRAGSVSVGARAGTRRLGGCALRGPAGRPMTCRVALPHGIRAGAVVVRVTLRVGGKVVAARGARLPR